MSTSPTPFAMSKPLKEQSTVFDLKARLDWGEPALTIIDTRSREAFNIGRITGAISMPTDELVARVSQSLESDRDIYVYGDTDEQTVEAATKLREAGYQSVAELQGGLAAWKAADGPVEGSFATV
ncbi:MAG: rhodanese-like domain-containing protein [Cyanobacteria bacterium J06559_3]